MDSIRDFFIVIFLVSGIVIGGSLFFGDISNRYSYAPVKNFSAFDTYMNDTYEKVGEIEAKLEDSKVTGIEVVDKAIYFVRGSYEALSLTLGLPQLFSNIIKEAVSLLGLPVWVKTMLLGIVIVSIVFLIVSVALGSKV